MITTPLIEKNTDGAMRLIADYIKTKVGERYGFAVLVFPFGDEQRAAHYISNSRREDMIKALREKADVLEAGLDIENDRHHAQ